MLGVSKVPKKLLEITSTKPLSQHGVSRFYGAGWQKTSTFRTLVAKRPHGFLHVSKDEHGDGRNNRNISHSAVAGSSSPQTDVLNGPLLSCVGLACVGAFAFGYHLGVVNGPLEVMASQLGFAGNKGLEGLVVSSTLASAAVGSLSGGPLGDAYGRRAVPTVALIPLFFGPLLIANATNFTTLAVGRALSGLAIGMLSTVPTFLSEVSPSSIRGVLGASFQLFICIGILAALVINVVLPPTAWRTMFAWALVLPALLVVGLLAAPESPRWLASRGRTAEAADAARKLWGPYGPSLVGASTEGVASESVSLGEMFGPRYRRTVLIGCILFAFQQFAGINALVYFSTSIFRQAGVASTTMASAAVGLTNVVGTVLAAGLLERAGRCSLLKVSYLGQAVCMAAMAAALGLPALREVAAPVALVGTIGYVFAFALGAGPVTGLLVSELNPMQVRGRAMSAAMVSHWVCNVALGQTFPAAVAAVGIPAVYSFFAAVALGAVAYVSAAVPETKGKSLEMIEAELRFAQIKAA